MAPKQIEKKNPIEVDPGLILEFKKKQARDKRNLFAFYDWVAMKAYYDAYLTEKQRREEVRSANDLVRASRI